MLVLILALTFQDAWRMALDGPRARIPRLQEAKARVSFIQSVVGILPWGSVSARYTSAFTPPPSLPLPVTPDRYYSHVISLRFTLFSPLWVEEAVQARGALREASLETRQALYDLYVETAQAYAQAWQAQEVLKLRRARMERARLALEATRKRMALGDATDLDLLNAQYAYLQAESRLREAEKNLRDALDALAALLGRDALQDTLEVPEPPAFPLPDARKEPGYLRASTALFYAGLSRLLGVAAFLPEVTLEWTWSRSAFDLPAFSDLWKDQRYLQGWTVSLNFSLDRYVFGLWDRHLDVLLARQQTRQAYLDAGVRARTLQREEELLRVQEEERRKALEVAQRARELAEKRYALGEISLLELLQAQDQYLEAEEARIALEARRFVHHARRAWEVIP